MSSKLQFLQNHCLILKLALYHNPKTASRELAWTNRIVSELSKICKVVYARPTFTRVGNTFSSQQARIDLVLSSYGIDQLATVLFNVRGIVMGPESKMNNQAMCPDIEDYFVLEQSNPTLERVRQRLIRTWSNIGHKEKMTFRRPRSSVLVSPWIFNSRPTRNAVTDSNQTIELNLRNLTRRQYDLRDHRGSRFFPESSPSTPDDIPVDSPTNRLSEKGAVLWIKPVIYEGLDTMPSNLQKWLYGVLDDDTTTNESEQARLDLMMHGFKGFT